MTAKQVSGRLLLLLLFPTLWLALGACSAEGRRSTLEALRSAVDPPLPPADTVPEMLDYAADLQVDLAEMAKLPLGVLYADLAPVDSLVQAAGDTLPVTLGDSVEVSFQGWLPNGIKVDSTLTTLRIGSADVIPGIEAALPGMKPGGRRKLVLSPGLAFGAEGRENIPPNSVLVYDVELRARIR